jgi:tRNA threonylcarbamoyladenosine biosynthesis protein TsaE
MSDLTVREAAEDDAATVRDVIHAAFEARPVLDPPSTALAETTESVRKALVRDGGLLCLVDGEPAGALLFAAAGRALSLRRVSAVPHLQSRGVASAIVGVAEEVAEARGYDDVSLLARAELPGTVTFWRRRGYAEVSRAQTSLTLAKALPARVQAPAADDAREVGRRLATLLRCGDLVILSGDLGAGKTTLAQGVGAGLGVRGDVTSPTFVISRIHPSLVGGPALVHVDAYRLGDGAELDDLDIDEFVDESVTVVEWGEGVAEALAPSYLRVHLSRRRGGAEADHAGAEQRNITVTPVGARWVGAGVRSAVVGPRTPAI